MKVVVVLLVIFLEAIYANIGGKVFRDLPIDGAKLNDYGILNNNEFGVEGVTVKLYNTAGEEIASTITREDGNYTFDISIDDDYRIEFSGWVSYLKESPQNNTLNSSVRFAKNGDTINFGLHNPDDFTSTTNPKLITSVYFNGATSGDSGDKRSLVMWDYNDTQELSFDILAKKSDIGSVWGLAYDKRTKDIYTASILKRHIGLLDADGDGNGDIGVIYKINRDTGDISEFYRFSDSEVGTIGT